MLDVVAWTTRSLAEEVHKVDGGWLLRTPALPQVWDLNQLHLTRPVTPAVAVALSDALQSNLTYRCFQVDVDPRSSAEEAFRSTGWNVDRDVYMVLASSPEPPIDASDIEELNEDEATTLMSLWVEEDHPGISPSSRAQLEEASRREGRLWGERCFGIFAADRSPLAMTKLRTNESVAWVEDVFTAPWARRQGHARRLVSLAASLAAARNPDLTFIIADDNDWPKELYASIGFRPVGWTGSFHREVSGTG